MKIFQSLVTSLAVLCVSFHAGAQSASQTDVGFAKQKYQIAQGINKISENCKFSEAALDAAGINKVLRATVEISAKDYADYLNANGQSDYVASMDEELIIAAKNSLCSTYKSDPNVQSFVQASNYLVNEMLYAISLSGVTECGEVTNLIAPVVGEANRVAAGMSARPDLNSFKSSVEKNAEAFQEMCDGDNMFDGNYLFMAQEPFGKLVVEMTKIANK